MIFDITRLNNNIDKYVEVDKVYTFTKEQLEGTDLLKLENVKVNGRIIKNSLGNIELDLNVTGKMTMPCAITLKPVDCPFNIEINGELDELIEEKSKNFQNTIDILPIIWENILLEIPMRVVSEEAKDITLEGDGWRFTTGDDKKNNPFMDLLEDDTNSEVK